MSQILKKAVSFLYRWIAAPAGLLTLAVVVTVEYQVNADAIYYGEVYQNHNELMEKGAQRTFVDIQNSCK